MNQVLALVTSNIEVMPGTHLIWLESPETAATARPGQFVMVRCGQDTLLRRPMSIHQVDGGRLAMLVTIAGKGTRWLSQRQTGDVIDIFGPLGNGFIMPYAASNILLVAGGSGIAPLRFLADAALSQKMKVTLVIGARSADYLLPVTLPAHQFKKGVLPSSINVVNATDDGSEGFKGPATDLILAYLGNADHVFACGPVGMYRTMAQMPELKNKSVQISLEIAMACGIGICYSCTIKTRSGLKQVCKDGPVFDMNDIVWEDFGGV